MKNVIVCDIDGTIADGQHRVELITQEKPDWDTFYDKCDGDVPIWTVITSVMALYHSGHYRLVFCTGRNSTVREKTDTWIKRNLGYSFPYELIMRPNGDHRSDTIVKPEMLLAKYKENEIFCIFEDRNKVVKTWRDMGLMTFQVAEGDF